jgi:integrase
MVLILTERPTMSLGRQAKTLTKGQAEAILGFLLKSRYPIRNRAIFLLSLKAGLRAKEIALLSWEMITDADGQVGQAIHLQNKASKGRSGRIIPMNGELKSALQDLKDHLGPKVGKHVISTERSDRVSPQTIVNMFSRWYEVLGFTGCSSHSGRRTFITNAARRISAVGGSIRDVQELAGHTNLRTTQRYIDVDADAQRKVVQML